MNHKLEVKEKVLQLFHDKTGIELDRLDEDATLRKDLSIDSLDLMEILLEAEKIFKIKIEDEEAEQFETISDVCMLIISKVKVAKASPVI